MTKEVLFAYPCSLDLCQLLDLRALLVPGFLPGNAVGRTLFLRTTRKTTLPVGHTSPSPCCALSQLGQAGARGGGALAGHQLGGLMNGLGGGLGGGAGAGQTVANRCDGVGVDFVAVPDMFEQEDNFDFFRQLFHPPLHGGDHPVNVMRFCQPQAATSAVST